MLQAADFEIDQYEAFQQVVVKHKIDEEVLRFGSHAILPTDECKAFAEFEQKRLQVLDDRGF